MKKASAELAEAFLYLSHAGWQGLFGVIYGDGLHAELNAAR